MKETADEAVAQCPSVKTCSSIAALGREIPWTAGRDHWWHEAVAGQSDRAPAHCRSRPTARASSSTRRGRPGRPKGAVLTHGGFLIKTAHDFALLHGRGRGRPAVLAHRPRLADGADGAHRRAVPRRAPPWSSRACRTIPEPDRLWSLVERHRVTVHGPLAHRRARAHAARPRARCTPTISRRSASSGSTGEPWNPEPYRWLFENAGKARIPIINYTGGTEISGGILGLLPDRAASSRARSPGRSPAWPPSASATTARPCAGRSASW